MSTDHPHLEHGPHNRRGRRFHRHEHHRHGSRRGGFGPSGFEEFPAPGLGPDAAGFGGPRGPRGRRGHRGRRSRGDIRLAVLALLAEQPRHGYEIIQEIGERTSQGWRPSPGSVYPAIQQLEDEGLVRTEESEGRRTVHLTDAGTRHVEERRDELDQVWAAAAPDEVSESFAALRDQYGLLYAAVSQIASAGTDPQRQAAATALAEARKAIYRLLGED